MRTQWTLVLAATLTVSAAGAAFSQTGPAPATRPSDGAVKEHRHQQHACPPVVVKQTLRTKQDRYRSHARERRHVVKPPTGVFFQVHVVKQPTARARWNSLTPQQRAVWQAKMLEHKAKRRDCRPYRQQGCPQCHK